MKGKLSIAVLVLATLLWTLPVAAAELPATGETALAATAETAVPEQGTPAQPQPEEKTLRLQVGATETDQADGDALFGEYLQRLMYPDRAPSTLSNWGEDTIYLNEKERQVYDVFKTLCTEVADGKRTETNNWWIPVEATVQLEGRTEEEALLSIVDFYKVTVASYWSWGYELYWRNTGSFPCEYFYDVSGDTLTLLGLRVGVIVSVDYRAQPDDLYHVNPEKTGAAQKAVENARQIAASYEGKTDYEKLKGFLYTICDMVSYDWESLEADIYGDPWQLVSVFDGDPNTNVVCEGYAKAYQYLCDLAGIPCYLVIGNVIVDDQGPGVGHMWNNVILDGKTYLVDPTNCDSGNIGMPDQLFLRGAARNADGSYDIYTFVNGWEYKVHYALEDYSEGGGLMDQPAFLLSEEDYPRTWKKAMRDLPEVVSYGDEFSQMLCGTTEQPDWSTSGCAVVYGNGWVAITGIGDFSITATLSDGSSYTVSGTAVPRKMTPTVATAQNKTYDGSAAVTVTDVPLEGVISEGEVSVDLSGVTGTLSGADAGHYDTLTLQGLKLTGRRADCYTIDDTVQVATDVTVEQATAPTVPEQTVQQATDYAGTGKVSLAGCLPDDAGTLTYEAGTAQDPAGIVQSWTVDGEGNVTYTLAGTGTETRAVLPVTVRSANYAPVTVSVVVTLSATAGESTPAPEVTPTPEVTPAPGFTPVPEQTARPTASPVPAATPAPAAATAAPTAAPASAAARVTATIPQTGDDSNPVLWGVLLVGSALALVSLAALRRKGTR